MFDYLIPTLYPYCIVYVYPRSHGSASDNDVKFIRENKSPEGKSVEIFSFWRSYKNPIIIARSGRSTELC